MKQAAPYTVLYEDEHLVVLNKRSGILTAADRYDPDAPCISTENGSRFGRLFPVHRLDKETSGAVVYARTPEAHRSLSMQFEQREVLKIYHALVNGRPQWTTFRADSYLIPDGDGRHRTITHARHGKPSITDFTLTGVCGPFSWLEARPLTGRTHQIRAHLAEQKLFIVCDSLYAPNSKPVKLSDIKRAWKGDLFEERPLIERLALHAYRIQFRHPADGKEMNITAPYPKDMEALRKQLAKLFGADPLSQPSL